LIGQAGFNRFYLRVTVLPATARAIVGDGTTNSNSFLSLNPDGSLAFNSRSSGGVVSALATSQTRLTDSTRWYCIEWLNTGTQAMAFGDVLLKVDQESVTGTTTAAAATFSQVNYQFGASDTIAATYTVYFDDVATDSATWVGLALSDCRFRRATTLAARGRPVRVRQRLSSTR
jgi:hypothetical protein